MKTLSMIDGCSIMSKMPNVDALEVIVRKAVARNGDNWAAVDADIRARLAALPEDCLADLNKELNVVVTGALFASTCDQIC